MDKQEYKMRAEEIKTLISKREFFKAVKIADEIDWTRVRSVAMLCTVSDLYKVNRRYKESKELLLMAYERHPNGRMILYSLCELCLKMGEIVQAIEYYKEFVQLAPMDNGKYILQYKLYVAQEVSLEERIAVLEEFKRRDYREKWGYELAYLYHRVGLSTRCVEECDELILWFSDGRYVKKAMELKMLHQPLTPAQEASYNSFIGKDAVLPRPDSALEEKKEEDIQVAPVNVGQYNTINLQKALAESMKEVLDPSVKNEEIQQEKTQMGEVTSQIMAPMLENERQEKEIFYEDKTGEIESSYSGENKTEEKEEEDVNNTPKEEDTVLVEEEKEKPQQSEEEAAKELIAKQEEVAVAAMAIIEPKEEQQVCLDATKEITSIKEIINQPIQKQESVKAEEYKVTNVPRSMEKILSQDYDGQISMVVPPQVSVEKQITGQMNIEEVLSEWEKMKKDHEQKRRQELTQKVLEQTGNMFTEFEEKVRDGVLEQLQKEENLPLEEEQKKIEIAIAGFEASQTEEMEELEEIKEEERENAAVLTGDTLAREEEQISVAVQEILESFQKRGDIPEKQEVLEEKEEEVQQEPEKEEKREEIAENTSQKEEDTAEEIKEPDQLSQEKENEEILKKIAEAKEELRDLTEEEKALFGSFLQTKGARRRFLKALDLISLSAYTGNVIITGEGDLDTLKMAKNIMKDLQNTDANFSGVIAKVTGSSLNSKSVESTINKLNNGGLIIEKASGMNSQAVMKLLKALNQEQTGIVVIMEDNKKAMKRMLAAYPSMEPFFNARIELEGLHNDALAAYGRQYAAHLEYAIDDLGMLALQTKIEDRQTSDHIVTVTEVRELVDEAIYHVNRKNLGHLFDLVLGKRYDDNDMIILREKDFI
ncbi:MAG: hypothetical protein IKL51_06965 [Lachnospiraceae bacterium]|nr:hypothetical protein [Lachnospiraceae bacterium]